jgi:hypothetical protein
MYRFGKGIRIDAIPMKLGDDDGSSYVARPLSAHSP